MARFLIRVILIFMWAPLLSAAETPRVVASIKPLSLLTNELLKNTGITVGTLLPAHASEHGYALKISDIQRLQRAQLVIWMGHELEPYLANSQDRWLDINAPQKSLFLLESDEANHEHHAGQHEDPHLWLDPQQALLLAALIASRLHIIFPEHKMQITNNLEQFRRATTDFDRRWQTVFAPYKNKPFLVFHDAYRHWARHYGARQLGAIHGSGSMRGARHLAMLGAMANQETGTVCLFVEPAWHHIQLPSVLKTSKLKKVELDPLGQQAQSYLELMEALNRAAINCFGLRE